MSNNASFINKRIGNLYNERKGVAERVKSNCRGVVDPILQRGNKYNVEEPPKRLCSKNYFERMREKEVPKGKKILNNNNNQTSNSLNRVNSKKVFVDRIIKRASEMKIPSVKVFPNKLVNNSIPKLLKSPQEGGVFTKYRPARVVNPALGIPSDELKRINDRKGLLPCEVEEMYQKKFRRTKSVKALTNTADRVFTEYIINQRCVTPQTTKIRSMIPPSAHDNLAELITYKYGPNFKSETLPFKPNQQSYSKLNTQVKEYHDNEAHYYSTNYK